MSGKEIIFEKAGAVATIIFNRPEVHNALNSAMVDGLERALNTVQADQSIRCVILTGA
jgi:enoyl-CoA hydratase